MRVGFAWLTNCHNALPNESCSTLLHRVTAKAQQKFNGRQLSDDHIIQDVRKLFRAVGLDPTRYRPSGEALLRRALKGEAVRSINPLVDCNNICSMETGLPFGCYDATAITGDITIRLGLAGEHYQGVAKPIDIAYKLCAADSLGAFGSPISDSDRTKIKPATTNVLVLCFSHTDTPVHYLQTALQRFTELTQQQLGAQLDATGHS